jgi:hypothetical protein
MITFSSPVGAVPCACAWYGTTKPGGAALRGRIAQHGVNHLFGCVPFFETRPRVTVTGIGRSHNRLIGRLVHVLRQQRGRRAGTQALQGPVPVPAR